MYHENGAKVTGPAARRQFDSLLGSATELDVLRAEQHDLKMVFRFVPDIKAHSPRPPLSLVPWSHVSAA